jgi:hypothetical protein
MPSVSNCDTASLDTVVVPAHEDGFEQVFLKENRWYAVKIHPRRRNQLKYVAVYLTAPISAITHYAPIHSIKPWLDSGKLVINFAEPASKIGPLKAVKNGRVKALQGPRYTSFEKLKRARNLDEAY